MSVIWKMAPMLRPAKATLMRIHSSGRGESRGRGRDGGRVGVGVVVKERTVEGGPREENVQRRVVMVVVVMLLVLMVMVVM